jgi:hypothetical protein
MRSILYLLLMISAHVRADTIEHYMNIVSNIPQMEMKADQQSQAWARSARTVLILASESIAETLILSNESARQLGAPLFCLPPGAQLDATTLNDLIQQTYREISSQQSDKNKMTVSQVALLGLSKKYPCQQRQAAAPQVGMTSAWGNNAPAVQTGSNSTTPPPLTF